MKPQNFSAFALNRRAFIVSGSATLVIVGFTTKSSGQPQSGVTQATDLSKQFSTIEKRAGGRLGVCVLDMATGHFSGHRMGERFGMCSTFKLPLAAVILREIDAGRLDAEKAVKFGEADMLRHAPVTRANLKRGEMTILELAKATQITSDNPAANLLLDQIGGPKGMTEKLRAMGDTVTRVDRNEPAMNLNLPGDPRDTTTPQAMAALVGRIFSSDILSASSLVMLRQWTIDTQTGLHRLRKGLPKSWIVGDKTGTGWAPADTGMVNKHNDIAICWRPGIACPLIITAYYDAPAHYPKLRQEDNAVLATIGHISSKGAVTP